MGAIASQELDAGTRSRAHVREAVIIGGLALLFGLFGAAFGPVGAFIGLAIGAATGYALSDRERRPDFRDAKLDRDIGVAGGNLGAATPDQPLPRIGAYSASSCGAGAVLDEENAPDEGPMPMPRDDG